MKADWRSWDALTASEVYALVKLRQDVFIVEQRCAYPDLDGRDPDAHHLLVWEADVLAGVLRAFPPNGAGDVIVGRVVVAPPHRRTGLGRRLMRTGMAAATSTWGAHTFWLSGQAHLQAFYESLGFSVCGPGYDEDGIPHLPMRTGSS